MEDEMTSFYSPRFLACVGMIIKRIEGGYVNDPSDPGGETKFGISKSAYPNLDIANLTEGQAIQLYLDDYWNKSGCDSLPVGMDLWVFDGAINHGVGEAIKLLQGVVGVAQDGVIGPVTAAAAMKLVEPEMYLVARFQHYMGLAGWAHDNAGWMKRLFIVARGV